MRRTELLQCPNDSFFFHSVSSCSVVLTQIESPRPASVSSPSGCFTLFCISFALCIRRQMRVTVFVALKSALSLLSSCVCFRVLPFFLCTRERRSPRRSNKPFSSKCKKQPPGVFVSFLSLPAGDLRRRRTCTPIRRIRVLLSSTDRVSSAPMPVVTSRRPFRSLLYAVVAHGEGPRRSRTSHRLRSVSRSSPGGC